MSRASRAVSCARVARYAAASALRRSLDHWLLNENLKPRVVAEYDDGALMKIAAADGLGVLPIPAVAERLKRLWPEVSGESGPMPDAAMRARIAAVAG